MKKAEVKQEISNTFNYTVALQKHSILRTDVPLSESFHACDYMNGYVEFWESEGLLQNTAELKAAMAEMKSLVGELNSDFNTIEAQALAAKIDRALELV